ncbi:MAG: cation diffusion facilitator family transporter [Haloarculaceae archaeon]
MADHDHASHDHRDSPRRALVLALAVNTGFFVVELAGALVADSLTLLADASHMLTDSASLGLALFAAWVATRPADERRTYGYQRAEVLGALLNGLFLLAVVGYVLFDAYRRVQNPQPVDAGVVVGVGLVGLGANLLAAWLLSGHRDNLNVEGAFVHLLADAAGSVAAVVVGAALTVTDLYVLDPLFAVLVAALVLYSTVGLLRESVNVLLQGAPADVAVDAVRSVLVDLDGVADVHDVHVWAHSSSAYALSAHVVVEDGADRDAVLRQCQRALAAEFDIDHATVQLEAAGHEETVELDCYVPDAAARD